MQKDLLQKQFDIETAFTTSNYGDSEEDHIEKILFEHDALILLQHEKVITLGTGSTTDNLKFDAEEPPKDLGFEVRPMRTRRRSHRTFTRTVGFISDIKTRRTQRLEF